MSVTSTVSAVRLVVAALVIFTWVGSSFFLSPVIINSLTHIGTNIISGEEIAIKLESVKAKHPQLE